MKAVKRHARKCIVALALIAILLGALALGGGATAVQAAPAHPQLSCAQPAAPCI